MNSKKLQLINYRNHYGFDEDDAGQFSTYESLLRDGNTVAHFINQDFYKTVDSNLLCSKWMDFFVSGRDLEASGTLKPLSMGQGVRFNGSLNAMKVTAGFTWVQPAYYWLRVRQKLWQDSDIFFDGHTSNTTNIRQKYSSPNILGYAGSYGLETAAPLNTWFTLRVLLNGANSKIQINNNAPTTGNLGNNSPNGFTLASYGNLASGFAQIDVREVLLRKVTDSANESIIYDEWLRLYTPTYTIGCLGDSLLAQYSSGWWQVIDFIYGIYTFHDYSVVGDKIADQKSDWIASPDSSIDAIFIQVGLNDINAGTGSSTIITALQDLVDTVRLTLTTKKIIICTLTPIKSAWGVTKYNVWLAVNEAIRGEGATPITGVDGRVSSHTTELDDGSGNLKAIYSIGDGVHTNNLGRNVNAASFKTMLNTWGM